MKAQYALIALLLIIGVAIYVLRKYGVIEEMPAIFNENPVALTFIAAGCIQLAVIGIQKIER